MVNIMDFKIRSQDLSDIVHEAWGMKAQGKTRCHIACANPHSLVVSCGDKLFETALKQADILLPDGIGIVLAGRLLGKEFSERVSGMEFFCGLSVKAQSMGGARYFFLGSTWDVLEKIAERIRRDYPAIEVCGMLSPPYKEEFSVQDNKEIIEKINQEKPDVLWVGMTAPKQEKWVECNKRELNVPLIVSVGAMFDFYADTKKRAPKWLCDMGLEWLPRLVREPRRLWKRTFISTPVFLYKVLLQRYG